MKKVKVKQKYDTLLGTILHVVSQDVIRVGDRIVDEKGNEYSVTGFMPATRPPLPDDQSFCVCVSAKE